MINRVKKWLGIEGVKLELILPEAVGEKEGAVEGIIRFQSLNTQTVTQIQLTFIERYNRGRGKEKLTDEYELGELEIMQTIEIPAEEIVEVPFRLPFSIVRSDMDEIGRKNFIYGGLVSAAKYISKVKSEFRVEAEAKVKGTALNPFDRKSILLK